MIRETYAPVRNSPGVWGVKPPCPYEGLGDEHRKLEDEIRIASCRLPLRQEEERRLRGILGDQDFETLLGAEVSVICYFIDPLPVPRIQEVPDGEEAFVEEPTKKERRLWVEQKAREWAQKRAGY